MSGAMPNITKPAGAPGPSFVWPQPAPPAMTGFESMLARMQGGVVYTLVCMVNSVFTLIAFLLIAVLGLDAVIPEDSSPIWGPIHAYMMWAAGLPLAVTGNPRPAVLDDLTPLFTDPLGMALFMVMLWVPFAVLAFVLALLTGKSAQGGSLRPSLLGRFAVFVNLPGRLWTWLIRLVFGWIFRNKAKILLGGALSGVVMAASNATEDPGRRWGNQYGGGYVRSPAPGPLAFLLSLLNLLFLFLLTLIVWSVTSIPYLFPIIGMMIRATNTPADFGTFVWGTVVAILGVTIGIWFPGICDFYRRHAIHLSVRERFDWFPLTPSERAMKREAAYEQRAAQALGGGNRQ